MTESYSSSIDVDGPMGQLEKSEHDYGAYLNICHKLDLLHHKPHTSNGWYNFSCRHFEVNDICHADVCHEVNMLFCAPPENEV